MQAMTDAHVCAALQRRQAHEAQAEGMELPCVCCGRSMPPEDVCRLGKRELCDGCFVDTCNLLYGEYGTSFLAQKRRQYLESPAEVPPDSDMLPENVWLAGCTKAERAHVLALACALAGRLQGVAYYPDWEREYCLSDPEWTDYVTKQEAYL